MASARRISTVLVAVAAIALSGAAALTHASASADAAPPAAANQLWPLVNPLIGTSGGVDTFPGADVPFGMMQWSPDTAPQRPIAGGYEYNASQISGFSLTHLSGAGCGAEGDMPILPFVGALPSNPATLTEPFSHDSETAQAGYYAVTTGSSDAAVKTELSVTDRAGISRFTFPSSTQSNLVFKLNGGTWSGQPVDGTSASIIGNDELVGTVTAGGNFCGHAFTPHDYTIHIDVKFKTPFTASTVYGSSANGGPAGVVLTFDTTTSPTLLAKVGISYTNDANAAQNLAAEIPGWSFAAVQIAARQAWNDMLGKIEVAGGTHASQVQFYTAMYHSLLFPSLNSDINGQYLGMDQHVHQVAPGHREYANFSGWDVYRSQIQLISILAPQQTSDAITSMLNDYDQSGLLPRWALPNGETYVTAGDPADPIIADAYAFGARGFDARRALNDMVNQATKTNTVRQGEATRDAYGYLPYDATYGGCCNINQNYLVSTELEFDTADFAIAALAKQLRNPALYAQFARRAQNWQHVFNPASGYMQPRLMNRSWAAGWNPGSSTGFEEGTSAQYTPMVPFNLQGLITAKGGNAAYNDFLDSLLQNLPNPTSTNANLNDEPSIEIPWEYDYTATPWKTQQIVRQAQQQLYFDAPAGQFGNDDLGAMSSWYVWSNLGMYPETPGTNTLVIGSPVFPLAKVHLPNGNTVTIAAPDAAPDAPYVHHLTIGGHTWNKPWLSYDQLTNGATMSYDLSTTPDTQWAAGPDSAPPSYQTGQDPAIGFTDPSGPVIVTAGDTTAISVGAQGTGLAPTTLHWTAHAPDGISISPTSGTLDVPATGRATTNAAVSVSNTIASGFYPITLDFTTDNGQKLPGDALLMTVQATDHTAIVADDLGNPDVANGLTVTEQGDGHTTPTTAGGFPGRTTTGSGSSYMYMKLDDTLVPGGDYQATAYVSYFDHGTGSWNIQYDSALPNAAYQNSPHITDTGTDTWKTAVIPLPDAAFSNRENGGSDLRLNIGVGAQTIGRVAFTVTGNNVLAMHLAAPQPTAPAITTQPQDASANSNPITFTAAATGDPAPLVQWQSQAADGSWADISGATGSTLTLPQPLTYPVGTNFRAVFANLAGSATSDPAALQS